jgi:ubiquinone/menaquinone biosynthesis C-methylase UbiE
MSERIGDLKDFYESRVWKIHHVSNPYEIVRVRHILGFLQPENGSVVLEVGCGGGTYTSFLAEAPSVIAVDVSLNAVKETKRNLTRASNIFFIVCDAAHLPLKDMAVDRLASIDVLEHLERPQKAVDEMSRVLRRQGRMLLFTACGENRLTLEYMLKPFLYVLIKSIRSMLGHVSVFTTETVREMVAQDFMVIHVEYMHHWAGWLFKFMWDTIHLNSPDSHQSQFESSGSMSRILWLPLEAEYRLFKNRPIGTEIIVETIRKSA